MAIKWKQVTGCPLIEAYGLTETSPGATINPLDLPAYNGTIGLPLPSTEVVLRDDDGKVVAQGLPGEQATMFFLDPFGNALEFKAFEHIEQLFAKQ